MPVTRIVDFDTWRPGYGGATVTIYRAGSSVLADVFTGQQDVKDTQGGRVCLSRLQHVPIFQQGQQGVLVVDEAAAA